MKQYFCNPINLPYSYQFNENSNGFSLNREAADPSMIVFKGRYYLFPSMCDGFFASDDMVNWQKYPLTGLPVYDYAPDVRAVGDWLYFSASRRNVICDFYRTKSPESGEFECIPGTFDFWDPHLFIDDDGRMFFYWGCSNITPVWGVELDPATMHKLGTEQVLIDNNKTKNGYERMGENHEYDVNSSTIMQMIKHQMAQQMGCKPEDITDVKPFIERTPEVYRAQLMGALSDNPYIEGAWMNKHKGKYYLQYAAPGAQYNVYCDGVYVGDSPLGPFTLAENNPFSYSPGGFCPGAGHGSTMEDKQGNWWHTSTMRISKNHTFERRVGIWPAGFDADGELFCNQRYGDWPMVVTGTDQDAWQAPEWMLLSYKKAATASSEANPAANAVDEDVQTWWKAASAEAGEWLQLDLGVSCTVNAVQINFADDFGDVATLPEGAALVGDQGRGRYIETRSFSTRWLLEGSEDGTNWFVIEDKRNANTDLTHDFIVREEGFKARYLKLTVTQLAYDAPACVSGLRVFGKATGNAPAKVNGPTALRTDGMTMQVEWQGNATGYEVLWGHKPDKLYHSYRVFGKTSLEIRALVESCPQYYLRVDAFNESGITQGDVVAVKTI